jgi:hypothetical protein
MRANQQALFHVKETPARCDQIGAANSRAQRLCVSTTKPISIGIILPSCTTNFPLMTVFTAGWGAQKNTAATGSLSAPA